MQLNMEVLYFAEHEHKHPRTHAHTHKRIKIWLTVWTESNYGEVTQLPQLMQTVALFSCNRYHKASQTIQFTPHLYNLFPKMHFITLPHPPLPLSLRSCHFSILHMYVILVCPVCATCSTTCIGLNMFHQTNSDMKDTSCWCSSLHNFLHYPVSTSRLHVHKFIKDKRYT